MVNFLGSSCGVSCQLARNHGRKAGSLPHFQALTTHSFPNPAEALHQVHLRALGWFIGSHEPF